MIDYILYDDAEAADRSNKLYTLHPGKHLIRNNNGELLSLISQLSDETDRDGIYTICALQTWNVNCCPDEQIANACFGVIGELAEVMLCDDMDEFPGELGDVLYYRYILRYLCGKSLALPQFYVAYREEEFAIVVNLLADVGKKTAYHGKFSSEKVQDRLARALYVLDSIILSLIMQEGLDIDVLLLSNLTKLQARHGASFNASYTR